jgi:pyruvate kinase
MLSAESAAGKYPLESVTMQQLVINKVESDEVFRKSLDRFAAEYEAHRLSARNTITSAITLAARQVRCFLRCGNCGERCYLTEGQLSFRLALGRCGAIVFPVQYNVCNRALYVYNHTGG